MNVVLLMGALSSEPRVRTLESGTVLMQWEVTTATPGPKKLSVPIAWFDPPASLRTLEAGEEVVVLGTVRRRFYHANGGLRSSTEVVAERGARARRARGVTSVVDAGLERMAALADIGG